MDTEYINFLFENGLIEMVIDDDSDSIKSKGIDIGNVDENIDTVDEFFDMILY